MYRLTDRMKQHLRKDLRAFHGMFQGGRCSGWELEELFVRAIKSDTTAQHHVLWREGGHDTYADIVVRTNRADYPIQIKSGKIRNVREMGCSALVLSGYRLTRFDGDFELMTDFLNNLPAPIIAVPCKKTDEASGRVYTYSIAHIDKSALTGVNLDSWEERGARWVQTTSKGVLLSLTQKMSWQVWWHVPLDHIEFDARFRID